MIGLPSPQLATKAVSICPAPNSTEKPAFSSSSAMAFEANFSSSPISGFSQMSRASFENRL